MDGEPLQTLYHWVNGQPAFRHTHRCTYSDGLIIVIELFRVSLHLSAPEALKRSRWPLWMRRLAFPSVSQFNRRVKLPRLQQGLTQVSDHFRQQLPRHHEKACDGKPLTVGGYSKDPDAKLGKAPGGWARGYKLHAVIDAGGAIEAWKVTSLNAGESTVARQIVEPLSLRDTVLRGDANYDSVALYDAVQQAGGRLLAPRRKPATGLGKRRQPAHRLRAIEELERCPSRRKAHDLHRLRIEQIFGRLTTVAFGIWGLPAHVRRLPRVTRWLNAKVALYHLYLSHRQTRQTTIDAA